MITGFGAIIGDIVGSRFEFANHLSKDFELFHRDCQFTDDTVLTVATMQVLLNEARDFGGMYKQYARGYPGRGYGARFAQWVASHGYQPYGSKGNGCLMRVSPCAVLLNEGDLLNLESHDATDAATASACATHDNPEAVTLTVEYVKYLKDLMFETPEDSLEALMTGLKDMIPADQFALDLDQCAATYPYSELAKPTLVQAVTAFRQSTDFEDCIRNAVRVGGDTDTICAIAGGMAEAAYGVPEDLIRVARRFLPRSLLVTIDSFGREYAPAFVSA